MRWRRREREGSERKTVLAGEEEEEEEDGTINTRGCMLFFDSRVLRGRRHSGAISCVEATGGLAARSDQRQFITPNWGLRANCPQSDRAG